MNQNFTSFNKINNHEKPLFGTQYIVEEKDNLYNIAHRFNITVNLLREINHLKSDKLSPGQIIEVDDLYTPGKEIYKEYIVKENDSIYKIASEHNMTADEIEDLNMLNDNNLKPGKVIIVNNIEIPNEQYPKYITKKGDSLYNIARKYNTTVDELKEINNLKSNLIHIGQELNVVDQTTLGTTYTVLPGDSLYSIAKKKGTTIAELMKLNKLSSSNLQINQALIIPDN